MRPSSNEPEQNAAPEFSHIPVLLNACIEGLQINPCGTYADCTLGGGGHSEEIVRRLTPPGRLLAIDQDICALRAAKERLKPYEGRILYKHANFSDIAALLAAENIPSLDGALIDLGVSSYQLDRPERGFSYRFDAPLDMRMDQRAEFDAATLVNTYSFSALCRVLRDYGEEKFAAQIASKIVSHRESKPIETTFELVDIIKEAIPVKARTGGGHPAKRTFQALRIEVNRELDVIQPTLTALIDALAPGGRLCVITFHSLEDRIVKQTFQQAAQGCTCPRDFPVCVCGGKPKIKIVTRKPIEADEAERLQNNRAHSAKLRIAQKLPDPG